MVVACPVQFLTFVQLLLLGLGLGYGFGFGVLEFLVLGVLFVLLSTGQRAGIRIGIGNWELDIVYCGFILSVRCGISPP